MAPDLFVVYAIAAERAQTTRWTRSARITALPAKDASYHAGFSEMTGSLMVVAGDLESVHEHLADGLSLLHPS